MLQAKSFFRICAVLVCLGMARIVFYEVRASGDRNKGSRIDGRYASLRALLPEDQPIGFLTDEHFARVLDSARYTQALYALAPRILLLDAAAADLWVADVIDPASLGPLTRDRDLEARAIFDDGRLVLLQRRRGLQ